jgi:hypothetical protein
MGAFQARSGEPACPERSDGSNHRKERYASVRHVTQKQPREIKDGQQVQDPKHEGESANLEMRVSSGRVEFRDSKSVVGYYDRHAKRRAFIGDVIGLSDDNAQHPVLGDTRDVTWIAPKYLSPPQIQLPVLGGCDCEWRCCYGGLAVVLRRISGWSRHLIELKSPQPFSWLPGCDRNPGGEPACGE